MIDLGKKALLPHNGVPSYDKDNVLMVITPLAQFDITIFKPETVRKNINYKQIYFSVNQSNLIVSSFGFELHLSELVVLRVYFAFVFFPPKSHGGCHIFSLKKNYSINKDRIQKEKNISLHLGHLEFSCEYCLSAHPMQNR